MNRSRNASIGQTGASATGTRPGVAPQPSNSATASGWPTTWTGTSHLSTPETYGTGGWSPSTIVSDASDPAVRAIEAKVAVSA